MDEYKITLELAPDELDAIKHALLRYSADQSMKVINLRNSIDEADTPERVDVFTRRAVQERRRMFAADSAYDKLKAAIWTLPEEAARIMRVI